MNLPRERDSKLPPLNESKEDVEQREKRELGEEREIPKSRDSTGSVRRPPGLGSPEQKKNNLENAHSSNTGSTHAPENGNESNRNLLKNGNSSNGKDRKS